MSDTSVNTSTNMLLPIPIVGTTKGSDYASDEIICFTLIDQHNHSAGSGVQITPAGININADLSFAQNSATNLKKLVLTSQAAALTGTGFISNVNGNLYFNDGSANQVAITSGGGVAGSPGSIGSLASPAAATYSAGSKLFTWTTDSAKSAAMDNGAVTIRETNVASAKGITLASPTALAADYQLTLPAALPGTTQYLTSTSGGVTSFSTADAIGSAMTLTGSNSISAARTRATGTSVAAGGVAISSAVTSFTTSSSTLQDVTNLSVTITTSGRPVFVGLIPDGSGTYGALATNLNSAATSTGANFAIVRGVTVIGRANLQMNTGSSDFKTSAVPLGSLFIVDAVASGTYTYKIQAAAVVDTTDNAIVQAAKLIAYEL